MTGRVTTSVAELSELLGSEQPPSCSTSAGPSATPRPRPLRRRPHPRRGLRRPGHRAGRTAEPRERSTLPPDFTELQESARRWGIGDGRHVVVYDDLGNTAAARAWWLLRHAGVTDVTLLDGALGAWRRAGLPLESGVPAVPAPGDITLRPGALPITDADGAAELAVSGLLLDARAGERYRGEVEPVDPRAGHIRGPSPRRPGRTWRRTGRSWHRSCCASGSRSAGPARRHASACTAGPCHRRPSDRGAGDRRVRGDALPGFLVRLVRRPRAPGGDGRPAMTTEPLDAAVLPQQKEVAAAPSTRVTIRGAAKVNRRFTVPRSVRRAAGPVGLVLLWFLTSATGVLPESVLASPSTSSSRRWT